VAQIKGALVKQVANVISSGSLIRRSQLLVGGFILGAVIVASPMSVSAQQPAPQTQQNVHQQHDAALPPGPGHDTFIRVCSKCHSPNNVIANGQNEQGWENTITKMVGFGATGTDAEFSEILDYLVKNFPPPSKSKGNGNTPTGNTTTENPTK
jgi:competence protein ComEA